MKSEQFPRGRGMSLWERISCDPRYLEEKRRIRARYGLPLDFNIRVERGKWLEWLGMEGGSRREQASRGQAFLRDVQALFTRFQVPEAWQPDFIADIAGYSSEDKAETDADDPPAVSQDFPELEKRNNLATPSRKRAGLAAWVDALWGRLLERLGRERKP